MKKLLTILFLAFSLLSQAQDRIMKVDQTTMMNLVDTLILSAQSAYKIESADTTVKAYKNAMIWLASTDGKEVSVKFWKGEDGYYFENIDGPFADLFPFWKKYFDPQADMSKITEAGQSKVIFTKAGDANRRVVFQKSSPGWMIIVRH